MRCGVTCAVRAGPNPQIHGKMKHKYGARALDERNTIDATNVARSEATHAYLAADVALEDSGIATAHEVGSRRRRLGFGGRCRGRRGLVVNDARSRARRGALFAGLPDGGGAAGRLAVAAVGAADAAADPARRLL